MPNRSCPSQSSLSLLFSGCIAWQAAIRTRQPLHRLLVCESRPPVRILNMEPGSTSWAFCIHVLSHGARLEMFRPNARLGVACMKDALWEPPSRQIKSDPVSTFSGQISLRKLFILSMGGSHSRLWSCCLARANMKKEANVPATLAQNRSRSCELTAPFDIRTPQENQEESPCDASTSLSCSHDALDRTET